MIQSVAPVDPRAKSSVLLSLIVPVYNEELCVHRFVQAVENTFKSQRQINLELIFINDGSDDGTLETLLKVQQDKPYIRIIDLSRNFGKESALSAGLDTCCGEIAVPIDVDLQDPVELIPIMIKKWREGYDMVLAERTDRKSDGFLKRNCASMFYRLHNKFSRPNIPENVGDFRLMDRIVIDALNNLSENNRYMKGLFAWVGFKTTKIQYKRLARQDGNSKFSTRRLISLAVDGFTGFSTLPIRIWTYIGMAVTLVSITFAVAVAVEVTIYGADVPGYASLVVLISFLGGVQLTSIGFIGEYLSKTYIESKSRPIYLIRRIY